MKPDKKEYIVLIHKTKENSTKTLKEMVTPYLVTLGFQNLQFPRTSQEIAGGAFSTDVWAYVLRYVQGQEDDKEGPRGHTEPVAGCPTFMRTTRWPGWTRCTNPWSFHPN